jgi:Tol biopolymer transport system component
MPLSAGTRLGPYEIVSPLGAGGMGEVYKARDTRLDRTVAIKVMPQHIAQREDLRQRFEREARVVSSLNHPYICVLHDIGKQDGVDFMVLEHLEGETLEARLIKGPLPLDQVFKYGAQVADALDRAHRSGVSHRDVKPSNIMLTRDGVKVLDFGLAKSMPKAGPSDQTLTLAMTGEGTVLGTPQYMAPELFEGKEADARSDIFGFGCTLYQMVTGKRAFDGKTRVSVVAAIIGAEPAPMTSLQPVTPDALERLVQGCLVKDPEERYQSMWDVLIDLRGIAATRADKSAKTPAKAVGKAAWLPWAVAVLFLFTAAAVTFLLLRQPAPEMRAMQFLITPPPDNPFTHPYAGTAVSPDGRYLVFGAAPTGNEIGAPLWLRPMDSLSAHIIPGTEDGNFPFWSPDSKSIAFFAGAKLKRADIAGGSPQVLCDDPTSSTAASAGVGGVWNREGVILFGGTGGLLRVAASGGVAAPVTKTDASRHEIAHGFPQFLPDGKRFLYFIQSSDSNVTGVYAGSLDRPEERVQILRTDAKAIYAAPVSGRPGDLLYLRDQTLMAQRFDSGNLRLEGEPAPLAEGVTILQARAAFWVSDAGLLVYRKGSAAPRTKMTWMSRDGKRLEEVGLEDTYGHVRLSPDGKRAAVARQDATDSRNRDVWLFDFGRAVMTRLTFDPKNDSLPVWSPDGRQIAFMSDRSGVFQVYRKDAGGGGQEEQLTEGPNPKQVTDWSRDGRYLLYNENAPKTQDDLWALPVEEATGSSGRGAAKPILVLQTPFRERYAVFSPDGKWIAYESNESGQDEVYVMAFPGVASAPAGKWQVSNQGGNRPKWRGDGKELFYVSPGGTYIVAVAIRSSATGVESDTPRRLFSVPQVPPSGPVPSPYDVTADGQRFLMLLPPGGAPGAAPLTVVVNWQAGLKQ